MSISDENAYLDEPFDSDCDDESAAGKQRNSNPTTNRSGDDGSAKEFSPNNKEPAQRTAKPPLGRCQADHRPQRRTKPRGTNSNRRPPRGGGFGGTIFRRDSHTASSVPPPGGIALEVWEANQYMIAQLRSENEQLKRELKECQLELKTVQRQCKVQGVRLTKAVGREAEMPMLVDRLNAEVRSLQIQLRRKSEQVENAERRAAELEQRMMPLLEQREREAKQQHDGDRGLSAKRQQHLIEAQKVSLEREQKANAALKRRLELMERNQKYEQNNSNEQIRKLRRVISELQNQLADTTRQLQEKLKLLELQNIYSQRLPKAACTLAATLSGTTSASGSAINSKSGVPTAPSLEALHRNRADAKLSLAKLSARNREMSLSSDRLDKELDQVMNRRYIDACQGLQDSDRQLSHELDNHDVQNLLNEAANALSSIPSRRPARRSRLLGPSATQETKPSPVVRNRSGRASIKPKCTITTEERTKKPVVVGRGSKKTTTPPAETSIEKVEQAEAEGSECSQRSTEEGSNAEDTARSRKGSAREASPQAAKNCEPKEKLEKTGPWRAITDDITDSDTADIDDRSHKKPKGSEKACKSPKLEDLQAELTRITERHENFKLESASKYSGVSADSLGNQLTSKTAVGVAEKTLRRRKPSLLAELSSFEPDTVSVDRASTQNVVDPLATLTEQATEPDRFELNKEDRLWEDLFGKDSAMNPSLAAVALQGYPARNTAESTLPASQGALSDRIRPPPRENALDVLNGGFDASKAPPSKEPRQTLGRQLANSVRRQCGIQNPLEDLDVEELPI
uniref:Uncharacterized protein n=2 Tax=Schistocephalus solidus TaxID=70667 RepID=A0A0X3PP55_SCHSO